MVVSSDRPRTSASRSGCLSCISTVRSPPSSRIMFGVQPSGPRTVCSMHHQNSSSSMPFQANTGMPAAAMAAAAWSWVEKMLQDDQRTVAPSAIRVSISTAVWMVMCRQPAMRAPASGFVAPNSARSAIRPGISSSAIEISLRPQPARLKCRGPCSPSWYEVSGMGELLGFGALRANTGAVGNRARLSHVKAWNKLRRVDEVPVTPRSFHDKSAPARTPARPPMQSYYMGGRAGVRAGADLKLTLANDENAHFLAFDAAVRADGLFDLTGVARHRR